MEMRGRSGLPDLRVLVVEDDGLARSMLMALVRTFGVDVWGAEDGEEALQVALRRQPDLVLCDVQMPRLDGFGFIRRLRRDPRVRGTLTVAVSGLGRPLDVQMTREAGFDGHIVKPLTPEVLARLLDRALDARSLHDQHQGA